MHKKLIVNVTEHETRVALLEHGTIVELFIERGDESDIAGNIYKGRVQRVLPGMQAAFVDIGLNQAAFIYVDDVICNDYKEFEQIFIKNSEVDHKISGTGTANH
ncbi:MAG: S1 RNA-binding domain-containing protein, partial [Proteobacteria bacterium]|nr:S1 RNA-binding domain-containing protein [Pseudomonadota bacterium]